MKIVVVEDEVTIREGLSNLINENTHHTVIAKCKNGLEGIQLIPELKPDLVITDIRMNEMDGLQMLRKLKEMGADTNSVILSGYSEFEYAREAIQLGVEDYLLKPISIDSVNKTLKKIEKNIEKKQISSDIHPEMYLQYYFYGGTEEQDKAKKYFESAFSLAPTEQYTIFCGYLGNISPEEMEDIKYQFRSLKRQTADLGESIDFYDEINHSRSLLIKSTKQDIRKLEEKLLEKITSVRIIKDKEIPWAMASCHSIDEWHKTYLQAIKLLSYGTIIGYHKIIHKEDITSLSFKDFRYPMPLEKKLISALSDGNAGSAGDIIKKFCAYLIAEDYVPDDLRHATLRFGTSISETARELNQNAYSELRTKEYPQKILQAKTISEWKRILLEMSEKVCTKNKKEGISNYTINRTLEFIRSHYKEGITLEETAQMLDITPEYLSTLFKREMGMNFSTFLKEFRISYAKRLLKGSNLKIYEIAEECGYNNSNYFTKVFKEVTGISPAEFR